MTNRMIMAGAALLLAACTEAPTETKSVVMQPTRLSMAGLTGATSGAKLDFSGEVDDMITRVLPSFEDEQVAQSVRTQLTGISTRAAAGELTAAQALSDSVRAQLTAGVASPVNLSAVAATLDVIDRDIAAVK
jgi:hypothetical protein